MTSNGIITPAATAPAIWGGGGRGREKGERREREGGERGERGMERVMMKLLLWPLQLFPVTRQYNSTKKINIIIHRLDLIGNN